MKLYPMKIECAWCKAEMDWGKCSTLDKISHGICDDCAKLHFPDAIFKRKKRKVDNEAI